MLSWEFLEEHLAELLGDASVEEVHAQQNIPIEIFRDGERWQSETEPGAKFWAALASLEESVTLSREGHRATLGHHEGKGYCSYWRAAPLDVELADLLGPRELSEGLDAGEGAFIIGPERFRRQKFAIACANHVRRSHRLAALKKPVPQGAIDVSDEVLLEDRLAKAVELGARGLFALEIDPAELRRVAAAEHGLFMIASVPAPHAGALRHIFEYSSREHPATSEKLAMQIWSVARDSGVSNTRIPSQTAPPDLQPSAPRAAAAVDDAPSHALMPPQTPSIEQNLPGNWASDEIEQDPGWEIDDEVVGEGAAFQAVLEDVQRRPTYAPRTPNPHPQMAQLQARIDEELLPPEPEDDD